jgi:hypothetical protein
MTPIPELHAVDVAFGNIKHLPEWEDLSEDLRRGWSNDRNPYCVFVSEWFFKGRTPEDMARLTPRDGVDGYKALTAVEAVLGSFEPKHEHKIAGCAFLLKEWFNLK